MLCCGHLVAIVSHTQAVRVYMGMCAGTKAVIWVWMLLYQSEMPAIPSPPCQRGAADRCALRRGIIKDPGIADAESRVRNHVRGRERVQRGQDGQVTGALPFKT